MDGTHIADASSARKGLALPGHNVHHGLMSFPLATDPRHDAFEDVGHSMTHTVVSWRKRVHCVRSIHNTTTAGAISAGQRRTKKGWSLIARSILLGKTCNED